MDVGGSRPLHRGVDRVELTPWTPVLLASLPRPDAVGERVVDALDAHCVRKGDEQPPGLNLQARVVSDG